MSLPRMSAPVKRVVFMGSPAFAVPSLERIHGGFEIAAVYSQPPRPAGRGQKEQPTPVHARALELGLTVRTPEKLRGEALDALLAMDIDAIVVVAYGLLLPKALVEARVCVNLHPSALPRWRGAAPMQWALLSGDKTTDICIMQLEAGMDTGPVFARETVDLPRDMTGGQLMDLCASQGGDLLLDVVARLHALTPTEQKGEPAHARKLGAEDRWIDWQAPASKLHDRVRALTPLPGAVCMVNGEAVKILRSQETDMTGTAAAGTVVAASADGLDVVCGDGAIVRLLEMQRPGKRAMPVAELLKGWDVSVGSVLMNGGISA